MYIYAGPPPAAVCCHKYVCCSSFQTLNSFRSSAASAAISSLVLTVRSLSRSSFSLSLPWTHTKQPQEGQSRQVASSQDTTRGDPGCAGSTVQPLQLFLSTLLITRCKGCQSRTHCSNVPPYQGPSVLSHPSPVNTIHSTTISPASLPTCFYWPYMHQTRAIALPNLVDPATPAAAADTAALMSGQNQLTFQWDLRWQMCFGAVQFIINIVIFFKVPGLPRQDVDVHMWHCLSCCWPILHHTSECDARIKQASGKEDSMMAVSQRLKKNLHAWRICWHILPASILLMYLAPRWGATGAAVGPAMQMGKQAKPVL